MTSIQGISELHMSGARAVFRLESGARLDEARIAQAFEAEGMKLESCERMRRPRAAAVYVVDAGLT